MQYVCRSCILRLGQPWRTLAQPPRRPQPWPRLSGRMNHNSSLLGDRSNVAKDDELHENHPNRDHETERFWTTDLDWSAASSPKLSNPRGVDRILHIPAPPSPLSTTSPTNPSKSSLEPGNLAPDDARQSIEEDWEAVAADEALDNPDQEVRQEATGHDATQPAQKVPVNSKPPSAAVPLSERDQRQLDIVRRTCQRRKTNFAKALVHFTSWKRLRNKISNPESKSPSHDELRMRHQILAADSVDSMSSLLISGYRVDKRRKRDRMLLYTALRHAPEKAAMLIQALLSASLPPFYMIEDSLSVLAYNLRQMDSATNQNYAQKLAATVLQAFQVGQKDFIRLPQYTIYSIMDALPPPQLEDWFHQLTAHEAPLHKNTLLQFARRFAKVPSTKDLSLDICRDLCGIGSLDINTPVGASLCTSLLAFEDDDLRGLDETLMTPAELFQCLLDLGLVPNVITYTCIIRSLCVKKELPTAMEVFEVMKQHGVQPDEDTYSVMVNGCKSSRDFGTLFRFASEARAVDFRDPVVWNDVIHATFLACLKEPRSPGQGRRARCVVWGPMNAIFTRFFKPEPLRTLIPEKFTEVREWLEMQGSVPGKMQGAFREISPLLPRDVMEPTSSTLSLMVLGFVRHLPRPYDVIHFYDNFKRLLKEGDPVAQSLVQEQGSLVHDIVLRALLKWKNTLRIMLDIVRDMMTDINPAAAAAMPSPPHRFERQAGEIGFTSNPGANTIGWPVDSSASRIGADITAAAADVKAPEGETENGDWCALDAILTNAGESNGQARPPIRHPRPSVYTWSILLKAFMSNRRTSEAEHILKLMQVHGVKPNIVTWNTLAAEYARLGNTKQAVEAMRRLEAAGFKSDDWTMRAFSYISDKAKAIRLMEEKVEENKMTMAAVEEMEQQQQQQGDESANDQELNLEGEMQADGSSDLHAQEIEMHGDVDQLYSTGEDTQPDVQGSSEPTGEGEPVSGKATEMPSEEAQQLVAKAPVPTKPDLGAWDSFLWDHAAEAKAEEQEKREDSAT